MGLGPWALDSWALGPGPGQEAWPRAQQNAQNRMFQEGLAAKPRPRQGWGPMGPNKMSKVGILRRVWPQNLGRDKVGSPMEPMGTYGPPMGRQIPIKIAIFHANGASGRSRDVDELPDTESHPRSIRQGPTPPGPKNPRNFF